MWSLDFLKRDMPPRHRLAWVVAIAADALQIGAFPFFAEGALSPLNDVLDVAVGAGLCGLLGWHWAFLPTVAAELVPGLDMFPTWTAAVLYVTHKQAREAGEREAQNEAELPPRVPPMREPQIIPPERRTVAERRR